jgi:hypothetical protein
MNVDLLKAVTAANAVMLLLHGTACLVGVRMRCNPIRLWRRLTGT